MLNITNITSSVKTCSLDEKKKKKEKTRNRNLTEVPFAYLVTQVSKYVRMYRGKKKMKHDDGMTMMRRTVACTSPTCVFVHVSIPATKKKGMFLYIHTHNNSFPIFLFYVKCERSKDMTFVFSRLKRRNGMFSPTRYNFYGLYGSIHIYM